MYDSRLLRVLNLSGKITFTTQFLSLVYSEDGKKHSQEDFVWLRRPVL